MKHRSLTLSSARTERTFNLSDGVFAFAMTLLVFRLAVPVIEPGGPTLSHLLLAMWPELLLYGLSFLVLGVLWMMHHAVFDSIEYSDATLGWLNILSLLLAALIPFSTSLIWQHGANQTTALVYGSNFLCGYVLMWLMFCYATSRRELVKEGVDSVVIRAGRRMGFVFTGILLVAIGLAFVAPTMSFIMYAVFVATFVLFTMIGRLHVIMFWSAGRRGDSVGTLGGKGPSEGGAAVEEEILPPHGKEDLSSDSQGDGKPSGGRGGGPHGEISG